MNNDLGINSIQERCKNLHVDIEVKVNLSQRHYDQANYCSVCEIHIDKELLRCPCCKLSVRLSRRHKNR